MLFESGRRVAWRDATFGRGFLNPERFNLIAVGERLGEAHGSVANVSDPDGVKRRVRGCDPFTVGIPLHANSGGVAKRSPPGYLIESLRDSLEKVNRGLHASLERTYQTCR